MLKGSKALMHAIETGSPVPTNEAQRRELSAEWQRTGDAATLAKLEAVEAKHTPGPWGFETDAHGRGRIKAKGQWIATTWTITDDDKNVRYPAEANARLIAAAPELLEACRTTLETLQWALSTRPANGSTDPRVMACVDLQETLEAAIAKAGGAK